MIKEVINSINMNNVLELLRNIVQPEPLSHIDGFGMYVDMGRLVVVPQIKKEDEERIDIKFIILDERYTGVCSQTYSHEQFFKEDKVVYEELTYFCLVYGGKSFEDRFINTLSERIFSEILNTRGVDGLIEEGFMDEEDAQLLACMSKEMRPNFFNDLLKIFKEARAMQLKDIEERTETRHNTTDGTNTGGGTFSD